VRAPRAQVLPADYYKEWLRLPYLTILAVTLGVYWAHPCGPMQEPNQNSSPRRLSERGQPALLGEAQLARASTAGHG